MLFANNIQLPSSGLNQKVLNIEGKSYCGARECVNKGRYSKTLLDFNQFARESPQNLLPFLDCRQRSELTARGLAVAAEGSGLRVFYIWLTDSLINF